MNLQEAFDFLNFWINKYTGAWYTIPELELVVDRGQMSLYEDLQPQYATSQRIKDALSPFRAKYNFTPIDTQDGLVTVPNQDYINLLDLQITFTDNSGVFNYLAIKMYNEDERAFRLMSQIDPVTSELPIGEVISLRQFQLYPKVGYTGTVTYFRRPIKPVFGYTVQGGRVIVYDPLTSVQLEWAENWHNVILMKALSSIGINIGEQDIQQYAELKNQSNFVSQNMV
jgi:hypothetical protein